MRFLSLPLLVACVMLSAAAYADTVQVPLDRTDKTRTTVGAFTFKGAVVIPPDKEKVGGLSGLWVLDEGRTLNALADTGRIFRLSLSWSADGMLQGVTSARQPMLRDEDGSMPKGKTRGDSESITRLPDGSWLVGFERDHRIERFADQQGQPAGSPVPWPQPPELSTLPRNEGLEALTILPNNGLLAIAEYKGDDGLNPAWQWTQTTKGPAWMKRSYVAQSGFLPVDAALLPSGDVLVLERGFSLFFGFRSRIARIPKAAFGLNKPLEGETVAMLESPLVTENFEGLAVLPQAGGKALVFMVSDNNMNAAQQTILAVFELKL